MKIWVQAADEYYAKVVADLVRLFFPQFEIVSPVPGNLSDFKDSLPEQNSVLLQNLAAILSFMEQNVNSETGESLIAVSIQADGRKALAQARLEKPVEGQEQVNLKRRLMRRLTLQVLQEITGTEAGPWGILTGIRPSKVVHRRLDQGWKPEQIEGELIQEYALDRIKAQLLVEVAQRQRPFLRSGADIPHLVSIYVGIPFCPSRCLYCSFPSYTWPRKGNLVELFLSALIREIQTVGTELRRADIGVQSIYVGGGTPTSLLPEQLSRLLAALRGNLPIYSWEQWDQSRYGEFTVEAGRPDTLDAERLEVMKESGVNRLSINPQTMQDRTLNLIGRKHSAAETIRAYQLARQIGFNCLNMDVILGLPGETAEDVAFTLKTLSKLQPDNLSVHTLAIKRASRLKEEREQWILPGTKEVETMSCISQAAAASMGMQPYYLYRQKNILGNLENVGYARPGWENIYNIQVMEERQTIIGLGGGAGSKWVNRQDFTLTNTYNPKDPQNYVDRIEEILGKKIDRIRSLG